MKSRPRLPITVIAAAALLCLVLVSASLTSGVFARYTVKSESPDDDNSAGAAAFNVSAEASTVDPVTIIANGTDDSGKAVYTVRIKNNSEVAVRYQAAVEFTGEQATENAAKFDNSDDQLRFSGEIPPNSEDEKTITMDMSPYFESNDRYGTFRNDDISGDKGKAPFDVRVTFDQID